MRYSVVVVVVVAPVLSVFVLGRPLCLRADLKSTFRYTRQGVDTSDCFEKGDLLRKYKDTKASEVVRRRRKRRLRERRIIRREQVELEFEFCLLPFSRQNNRSLKIS